MGYSKKNGEKQKQVFCIFHFLYYYIIKWDLIYYIHQKTHDMRGFLI